MSIIHGMNTKTTRERMNNSLAHQRIKLISGRAKIVAARKCLHAAEVALTDAQNDLQSVEVLDLDIPDLIAQIQTLQEVLNTSKTHVETLFEQVKPL